MFNRQPYFCFRAGRPYWIEYRAKLNTPKQPDGIFEVWANGVLVHAEYSVDIRGYAAAQIQCIFLNLYHGGRTNLPLSRFHVSIAAVTLAERYIGPPVPLSAEPPPVTPPVEPPMVDQLDFTLPCALVEDAAGDILVSGRRFRATLKTATPVPPPVVDPPPVVVPPVVTPPVESPAPPPGPSALAQLAASMPPGTWSPLLNQDIDLVLGSGNIGTSNNLIPYCNSMPYDALTKRIHVVSGDHGKFQAWYMTYDLAANRWSKVAALNPLDTGSTHGWDHTAVNPHTGEMYYRRTTSNLIRRFRNGALEDFSGPLAENLSQITAQGATWWDAGLSGAGAQGAFVLYVANVPHNLHIYDPLADAWTIIRDVAPEAPVGVYDNVIEYSPTHNCAVFGGGGNFGGQHSRRLYRLNADRSISKLPDAPIPIGTSEGNFVCEPRSGNFLLFGSGQFWMLDPRGAGSWTDLTTRLPPMAKPPAGMLDPATGNSVISSAIWDLGVVVYVACLSRTCGMWVYRHA